MVGNPDASLSFAARGSGERARHACGDHDGLIGSAVRPPVVLCVGRPRSILACSRYCRGRNRSRSRPGCGSLRRGRGARVHQPVGRPHTDMDEPPRRWDTRPACVPRHGCGARRRYELAGCDRRRAGLQRRQRFSALSPALGAAASWGSACSAGVSHVATITALPMGSRARPEHAKTRLWPPVRPGHRSGDLSQAANAKRN
jgi:hypothetical protein